MKRLKLTFTGLLLAMLGFSQNPHSGIYISLPNKNLVLKDIISHYDKGYYMEITHSSISGNGQSWNIKTDSKMDILWNYFITHNPGNVVGYSVVLDNRGNCYVGGAIFNSNSSSPFVVKFNPCGEQEWCILLPKQDFGYGQAMDLILNKREEIIALLQYSVPSSPEIKDRVFLAALNQAGELLWVNRYASPDNHPLLRQVLSFRLRYILNEYFITGYCYHAYPSNPNTFYLTPFFVGIDSLFQEKWFLPFGMSDNIRGRAYDVISLNEEFLMGIVDHWLPGIEKQTTLAFFDIYGNVKGYNPIKNSSLHPDYTWNVTTTAEVIDESVFISPIYFGAPSQKNFGEIIYDTAGNVYNFNVTGQHDLTYEMVKTSDENFIVGVTLKNNSIYRSIYLYKFDENLQSVPFDTTFRIYDSLCPYPIQSGTIDLTGCMVLTSTDWIPTPQEYYARIGTIPITIYPNPAKDQITFALENTEHHRNIELRCFNLLGVLQHQTKVQRGQQQASLNVSTWAAGMYVAVVYSDGKPVGRGKFVVQR